MTDSVTMRAKFSRNYGEKRTAYFKALSARRQTTPLGAAAVLLVVVVISETVSSLIDPRLPSAAVAMAIYFTLFFATGGPDTGTETLYGGAASVLPMLFVPVAVGVLTARPLSMDAWGAVAMVVIGGTLFTLVVVGLVAERVFAKLSQGQR